MQNNARVKCGYTGIKLHNSQPKIALQITFYDYFKLSVSFIFINVVSILFRTDKLVTPPYLHDYTVFLRFELVEKHFKQVQFKPH
jgi:hypothetical protein